MKDNFTYRLLRWLLLVCVAIGSSYTVRAQYPTTFFWVNLDDADNVYPGASPMVLRSFADYPMSKSPLGTLDGTGGAVWGGNVALQGAYSMSCASGGGGVNAGQMYPIGRGVRDIPFLGASLTMVVSGRGSLMKWWTPAV